VIGGGGEEVIGVDDILEAFKRTWDGSVALKAAVAGGLHWTRASETADGASIAFPYALLTVIEGEHIYSSVSTDPAAAAKDQGNYLGMFEAELKVYSDDSSPATAARTIRQALDTVFRRDRMSGPNAAFVIANAHCVDFRQLPGGMDLEEERVATYCARGDGSTHDQRRHCSRPAPS
jgi:hypothetical protein